MVSLILMGIAAVCFILAAANAPIKINLQALGLAFLTVGLMINGKY